MRLGLYCFLLCSAIAVYCENPWQLEEVPVLKNAQNENRPIVAAFLGSDCPWSKKLRREVLENPVFLEKVSQDAVLWVIAIKHDDEDQAILQKYHVQECPLFLLLDPKGKEFARFEYSLQDGEGCARTIVDLIENFHEICVALDQKNIHFEEEKWLELYQKAKKLSVPCFEQVILEGALREEKGNYFHLEKFAALLEKHKPKHSQVRRAKQQLLGRDPENKFGTHFKVAVLEFQKIATHLKAKDRPEKALMPLLQYIHKFGKKDPGNLWKGEWMIAEFLLTKNSAATALKHAEAAYAAAPDVVKPQIAETISFITESFDCLPGSDPDQLFGDLE
jgi:protein disulfide-isomerase